MSILDTNTVDFVAWKDSRCELVVSDHLDWSDVDDHLNCLVAKINAYIFYAVGGQLEHDWPGQNRSSTELVVFLLHRPPAAAIRAFEQLDEAIATYSLKLVVYWSDKALGVAKTLVFPPTG